jgi:hypothetical protein
MGIVEPREISHAFDLYQAWEVFLPRVGFCIGVKFVVGIVEPIRVGEIADTLIKAPRKRL